MSTADFFPQNCLFPNNSFKNTTRMSNILDPDLGPDCLQRLSVGLDDTSRQRGVVFGELSSATAIKFCWCTLKVCKQYLNPDLSDPPPPPPPVENHKNIGFLSNTGSDPLENP